MSLRREAQLLGKPSPTLAAAFTYELCAGILDKDKSIEEVASEEVGCTLQPAHSTLISVRHLDVLLVGRSRKSADIMWLLPASLW